MTEYYNKIMKIKEAHLLDFIFCSIWNGFQIEQNLKQLFF